MGAKEPNDPAQQAAAAKQIEKIKPEKEHKLEIKEKLEWKEHKNEGKELKNELKEHKLEWKEHKLEWKEHKIELKEQIKPEIKELKLEIEHGQKLVFENDPKGPVEGGPVLGGFDPVQNREALLAHADAMVKQGEELRHFIESSDRPDVSEGALKNEPDQ